VGISFNYPDADQSPRTKTATTIPSASATWTYGTPRSPIAALSEAVMIKIRSGMLAAANLLLSALPIMAFAQLEATAEPTRGLYRRRYHAL